VTTAFAQHPHGRRRRSGAPGDQRHPVPGRSRPRSIAPRRPFRTLGGGSSGRSLPRPSTPPPSDVAIVNRALARRARRSGSGSWWTGRTRRKPRSAARGRRGDIQYEEFGGRRPIAPQRVPAVSSRRSSPCC
jgi:hypothetical protein